mgnify:CR=1 FL=1
MTFSLKDLELLKTQRANEDTKRQLEQFNKNCASKLRLRVLEGVKRYIDYKENGPLKISYDSFQGNFPTKDDKIPVYVKEWLKQEFPDFHFSVDSGYEHIGSYGPNEPAYDQPYKNIMITWQGQ